MSQLLTVKEVAALLRISRSMIHKLHRKGVLRAVPGLGRCVRFRAEDVQGLINGSTTQRGRS